MSTAALFVQALETLHRLGWALVVWIVLTAATITLALYAAAVMTWAVCRAVWKAFRWRPGGPSWRRGRREAREYARTHARRPHGRTRPRWAHSQPIDHDDYREAA